MNIEQARTLRREAETAIEAILNKLQDQTGLALKEIRFDWHCESNGERARLTTVRIEMEGP